MVRDGPKLVILGADSTDDAVAEAVSIRKLWSNSKIVLLFEHASVADFQKVLMSEVDGCVPLFASPETQNARPGHDRRRRPRCGHSQREEAGHPSLAERHVTSRD